MPRYNINLILLHLAATLACAASTIWQSSDQRIPGAGTSREVGHTLLSLPNQTIGDYFDGLVSEDQSALSERTIHRTQAFTAAIWTDDKAGLYTAKIGNLPNATVQDIVNDLQAREGSEAANRVEYSSRVKENAELAVNEANNLLGAAIVDYTPITITDEINTYNELRHLLALAEMVVIIIQSSLTTEILVAFFAGAVGRVFGEVAGLGATLCAIQLFAVQMAVGIRHIVQQRPINFITATICNVFLAWVRDSARAFAGEFLPQGHPMVLPSVAYEEIVSGRWGNRTVKGSFLDGSTWPLAQDLVEKALERLSYTAQPRGRFLAATGFRPGGTCIKH